MKNMHNVPVQGNKFISVLNNLRLTVSPISLWIQRQTKTHEWDSFVKHSSMKFNKKALATKGNKFIMILNKNNGFPNLITNSKADKDTSMIIFILKNILKW